MKKEMIDPAEIGMKEKKKKTMISVVIDADLLERVDRLKGSRSAIMRRALKLVCIIDEHVKDDVLEIVDGDQRIKVVI